jgi:hypothetical protein
MVLYILIFEAWKWVNFQKEGLLALLHSLHPGGLSPSLGLSYGLDDQGSRVQFQVGGWEFFHHHIQNGSGAHPASYPRSTSGSLPRGKAARAWSRLLPSI